MKNIAVLSGDKRQYFANEYFNTIGLSSRIKNNFDFKDDQYILCGTPFSKDDIYLNCDLYSSYPISTFIALLKPGQTLFGGNFSEKVTTSLRNKKVKFYDILKDDDVVWLNAMFTAEGLISKIIENTPFSINNSNILIIGFGRCGINSALKLKALNSNVTIYDHTNVHLSQANSYGFKTTDYNGLNSCLHKFDIIINTVPSNVLTDNFMSLIKKGCYLFEIASKPYGINKELANKYKLNLITCPSLPGLTAPKSAGELIAKSIMSYLERTKQNGTRF